MLYFVNIKKRQCTQQININFQYRYDILQYYKLAIDLKD